MDDFLKSQVELVKDLGIFGIKTLLTVNSGATLALLAFMGNFASRDVPIHHLISDDLITAIGAFLTGVVLAIGAIAVTYIVVWLSLGYNIDIPRWFHLFLMIAPAALSLTSFVVGSWYAVSAFIPETP